MRIEAAALRRYIDLINGRPMTSRERAALARFLLEASRKVAIGRRLESGLADGTLRRMNTTDDQAKANPTLMDQPVPTGRTEGERLSLKIWGQALEKVGRRHDDLPAIRRGQRLQKANAETDEPER